MKVESDLPNYATKAGLKGAADVDTSNFGVKSGLARWTKLADKLDIDQFKTVPADLSKLSNVCTNWFVSKT